MQRDMQQTTRKPQQCEGTLIKRAVPQRVPLPLVAPEQSSFCASLFYMNSLAAPLAGVRHLNPSHKCSTWHSASNGKPRSKSTYGRYRRSKALRPQSLSQALAYSRAGSTYTLLPLRVSPTGILDKSVVGSSEMALEAPVEMAAQDAVRSHLPRMHSVA
jgi:hypothetical protein